MKRFIFATCFCRALGVKESVPLSDIAGSVSTQKRKIKKRLCYVIANYKHCE